jgi:hypothetical protein
VTPVDQVAPTTFRVDAPDHIWGQHQRARRKIRAAQHRWRRVVFYGKPTNGRVQCYVRHSRGRHRALMHERSELYWHERLQVIVPYIVHLDPKAAP